MDAHQHDLIQHVCTHPGMYVSSGSLDAVFSYLTGLDTATGCLTGFREWLAPRFYDGDNLAWPGLVLLSLELESVADDDAIAHLGKLLAEFYDFTHKDRGPRTDLTRVYLRYHAWLLNSPWYHPDSSRYIPPYDGVPLVKRDQESQNDG